MDDLWWHPIYPKTRNIILFRYIRSGNNTSTYLWFCAVHRVRLYPGVGYNWYLPFLLPIAHPDTLLHTPPHFVDVTNCYISHVHPNYPNYTAVIPCFCSALSVRTTDLHIARTRWWSEVTVKSTVMYHWPEGKSHIHRNWGLLLFQLGCLMSYGYVFKQDSTTLLPLKFIK